MRRAETIVATEDLRHYERLGDARRVAETKERIANAERVAVEQERLASAVSEQPEDHYQVTTWQGDVIYDSRCPPKPPEPGSMQWRHEQDRKWIARQFALASVQG